MTIIHSTKHYAEIVFCVCAPNPSILSFISSPGFKNTLALKDLKLALEQGSIDGVDLITGKAALKSYEDAENTTYKDLDWTSMFNFIKEKNN